MEYCTEPVITEALQNLTELEEESNGTFLTFDNETFIEDLPVFDDEPVPPQLINDRPRIARLGKRGTNPQQPIDQEHHCSCQQPQHHEQRPLLANPAWHTLQPPHPGQ